MGVMRIGIGVDVEMSSELMIRLLVKRRCASFVWSTNHQVIARVLAKLNRYPLSRERKGLTYRFIPVFLGFRIESIQSSSPYLTHLSHGLWGQFLLRHSGHRTEGQR